MRQHINHNDFISDDLFVYWRLHPSEELDLFWDKFIQENEHLKSSFLKAIEEFEEIRNTKEWNLEESSIIIKEIVNNNIKKTIQKRVIRRRIYASLSAAIFLLGLITTLFIINKAQDTSEPVVATIGEVMPDSKIQLLSGGDIIDIGDNSTLNLKEKENNVVISDSLSQKEVVLDKERINKLIVPFGKRSSIVLSDGTQVQLNSGTEMEFPAQFTKNNREIRVTGEIFIDVAKQDNSPFVIHTPLSQIQVFGTSFNVSAYTDAPAESVVLVNGSVQIKSGEKSVMLTPNEMAVIENGSISREFVDVTDYTSWKDGFLQLNKSPLKDVLKRIGRYYNVAFIFEDDLNLDKMTCSGKLFLSNNLEDILLAFSKMTRLSYEKQNEIIYIKQ